jgi:diketogulonate reductase-like aldo/keto reductase
VNRRCFLTQAGGAALGASLARTLSAQQMRPALTRTIPSTGEIIPAVGLGTWQTFDVGADPARRAQCAAALRAFITGGGRVIDSSPMYGTSERVVGDLLTSERVRDRAWLATKVWTSGQGAGIFQMTESLEKLGTKRVELMQVHNLLDWRVHLKTLRQWKDEERVKYIGITHYVASSHEEVERIVRAESIDFVQVNLSLDEPEAAGRLLAACAERRTAVIANRPFGGGQSFARARGKSLPQWAADYGIQSWAQYMLTWILSHDAVTCAIPGSSRAEHVVDNLGAGRGRLPDASERARMAAAWRAL